MNIGKYIRHLLIENKFVIVPGLGSFSLKNKPAQIDEENEEILPPSAEVSFDKDINHDDGVLASLIAMNEQISADEARQKILEFTELIFSRLDYGDTVGLSKIGSLFLADNREMMFEALSGELFIPEVYGLEKVSLKDVAEEEKEEEKEEIPVVPVIPEEAVTPEPEPETEDGEPEVAASVPPIIPTEPVKKRKRRNRWPGILLLLLIIILAAILFYIFNKGKQSGDSDKVKTELPKKEVIPEAVPEPAVSDTVVIQKVVTEAAEEPVQGLSGQIEPEASKYYLIGGSFQDEENAEKYIRQMKNKGFEPFHLGLRGSYYLVGLQIFDNKTEAFGAQYNFLDKYPDSGVWVYFTE